MRTPTITKKQFDTRRAELANERNEIQAKLDAVLGDLSLSNGYRDAQILSLEGQLRWINQDIDELWNSKIKG